jgi:hypothetical protein
MNKLNIRNLIISLVAALGLSVTTVVADGHKYTIDGSNYTSYTDKLSPGQITMFAAYPETYKMNVMKLVLIVNSLHPLQLYQPQMVLW